MKTVLDYIKLLEDTVPTNTISSGAIAKPELPIGKINKRLKPIDEGQVCPDCGTNHAALAVTDNAEQFDNIVPLANAYAPSCYAPTMIDIQIKRKSDLE